VEYKKKLFSDPDYSTVTFVIARVCELEATSPAAAGRVLAELPELAGNVHGLPALEAMAHDLERGLLV